MWKQTKWALRGSVCRVCEYGMFFFCFFFGGGGGCCWEVGNLLSGWEIWPHSSTRSLRGCQRLCVCVCMCVWLPIKALFDSKIRITLVSSVTDCYEITKRDRRVAQTWAQSINGSCAWLPDMNDWKITPITVCSLQMWHCCTVVLFIVYEAFFLSRLFGISYLFIAKLHLHPYILLNIALFDKYIKQIKLISL